jgi:hypothetical protein
MCIQGSKYLPGTNTGVFYSNSVYNTKYIFLNKIQPWLWQLSSDSIYMMQRPSCNSTGSRCQCSTTRVQWSKEEPCNFPPKFFTGLRAEVLLLWASAWRRRLPEIVQEVWPALGLGTSRLLQEASQRQEVVHLRQGRGRPGADLIKLFFLRRWRCGRVS